MSDVSIIAGAPKNPRANVFRANNIQNGISVDPGDVVILFDEVRFAKADAAATANAAGIAVSAGENPGSVDIQYAGPCTLTTEQWDAVTGGSGGLTPHDKYYLSPTTAGHLTTTKPTSGGNFATYLGFALSATTLMIQIGEAFGPLS